MSDFDREAEKQRLREKYEEEKADRETTQRMSELLLQGATMTNKHCETCGDPVFRYQGQEFCPTCQAGGDQAAADQTGEAQTGDGRTASAEAGDAATRTQETGDTQPADRAQAGTPETNAATDGEAGAGATTEPAGSPPGAERAPADRRRTPADATTAAGAAGAGDLADARASLVRTLTDLARRAERTDDVGRARELLAAAREAAEALAALDRTRP